MINVLEEPSFDYLCNKFVSLNKCVSFIKLFLNTNNNSDPQNK